MTPINPKKIKKILRCSNIDTVMMTSIRRNANLKSVKTSNKPRDMILKNLLLISWRT